MAPQSGSGRAPLRPAVTAGLPRPVARAAVLDSPVAPASPLVLVKEAATQLALGVDVIKARCRLRGPLLRRARVSGAVPALHALGTPDTAGRVTPAAQSMEAWAEATIEPRLQPVSTSWQPTDFLPDSTSSTFLDELVEFRARAAGLPADFLVALVGDTVTEEALPSYMSMLNRMLGIRDESGKG